MIDNPEYKGKWEHPMIPNPDYKPVEHLHNFCGGEDGCTHIGFEIWQVESGTVFDDIFVGDDLDEAKAFAKETFFKKKDKEKKMYDAIQKQAEEDNPPPEPEDFEGLVDNDGFEDEF
jgi:calreticulin